MIGLWAIPFNSLEVFIDYIYFNQLFVVIEVPESKQVFTDIAHINGVGRNLSNYIVNAQELLQSGAKSSILNFLIKNLYPTSLKIEYFR